MTVGIDYEGTLVLGRYTKDGKDIELDVGHWDGEFWIDAKIDPPISPEEDLALSIRVLPEDPDDPEKEKLILTIGERDPIKLFHEYVMPKESYVGVFVKGCRATFSGALVIHF
jgi:hypothetical protein